MGLTLVLRVLLVLVVLRLLAGFVRGVLQGLRDTVQPPGASGREMVRDRICNTFLPRDRALMAVVRGVEEPFCSSTCRDRALAPQPAR
jgi:hypothetical protein